jgi:hypothetical protein
MNHLKGPPNAWLQGLVCKIRSLLPYVAITGGLGANSSETSVLDEANISVALARRRALEKMPRHSHSMRQNIYQASTAYSDSAGKQAQSRDFGCQALPSVAKHRSMAYLLVALLRHSARPPAKLFLISSSRTRPNPQRSHPHTALARTVFWR